MTILVTGGGSGGHITPILAVAHELKKSNPDLRVVYVGQKGDGLADLPARDPNIDAVYGVSAGKLRRYHGEGWRQLRDVKTISLNIRDGFRVLAGLWQSWRLLRRLKPDLIFIKGGFVGVPVGLAAAVLKIPFITHDSDAIPGLANRIIARWARKHAVALPKEIYAYPPEATVTVGVPVAAEYRPVTLELKTQYRREINTPTDCKLLFIIGGGLGAQRVNMAIAEASDRLLADFPDLVIVHGVGRSNEAQMTSLYESRLAPHDATRVRVVGFLHDVYRYSGAADVVVTRAGATNLAEFAIQGKACVVVPNPLLTGGHQLKNAAYLQSEQAVDLVSDIDIVNKPDLLQRTISSLLADAQRQRVLGERFKTFAHPNAARELADLLLNEAKVS